MLTDGALQPGSVFLQELLPRIANAHLNPDNRLTFMSNRRVRGITAYIGNFSTWTHTFSTVLSTEFHVSDVDFLTPRTATTCAGTGVDSRTPADCPPLLPEDLLEAVNEPIDPADPDAPRSALLASILSNGNALVQ